MVDMVGWLGVLLLLLLVAAVVGVVVVLIVLIARNRGARVDTTADTLSRAAAAGVYPHSLRPPPDVQLEHEDTPIADEMPPEDVARMRDTGNIVLPEDRR